VTDFARLAATPCADHAALALLLARELSRPDGLWVTARLTALARRLPPAGDPATELHALGRTLAEHLPPRARGPLLLPDAVAAGRGHPAAVAVAGAGIARAAGIPVGIVGHGRRLYLAHEELDGPFLVDPRRPAHLIDARRLGCDLTWRCAHETAHAVLEHVAERAERELDLPTAMASAALRLMLPLDDDTRAGAEAEHVRLLARLN
jgi:hypothetical protein